MPESKQSSNIRIVKNTVVVYIRMAVTILVGLVCSRLVLQALGASDVGIYSAVGSAVALVSVITGALAATTIRFMNIELGKAGGNPSRMFNICHVIHLCGAAILFILLETIGLWYIHFHLNVPPGKRPDAMFVFQVSTIVACLGIANVPFQSIFTVHEKFGTVALVDILNALVKLLLVASIFLLRDKENGLRIYAVMMSVTTWVSFLVYHILGRKKWPSIVRWKPVKGWKHYKEVLIFSNYNFLASTAVVARSQGSNMLINAFFGTTVNAAFYYANTVQNYVNQFLANFDTAAAPQITQNIGRGDEKKAVELTQRVCRICILVFLLLFFPLWANLDFILRLWLGSKMPEDTMIMCRWTLLVAAVSSSSAGVLQLINAYGRIKWYKITGAALFLLCLPVGYFLFRAGRPAYTIIISFIIADVINRIFQFSLLHRQFGFDVSSFVKNAFSRPLLVCLFMLLFLTAYSCLPLSTMTAKLMGVALTFAVTATAILFLGLKKDERRIIRKYLGRKWTEWEWDHRHPQRIQRIWKKTFGRKIDWNNPRDLNEKIQWLICFSDTSSWTRLSDKIQVREYVKEKGLGDLLVPMFGSWKRSADIPYDELPEKFVLKCNHDSGSTHIVDKHSDRMQVNQELDRALETSLGYRFGETFYNPIPPTILAEEYLDSGAERPVDYKVWCLDGKPYCIFTCHGRTKKHLYINVFSTSWEPRTDVCVYSDHFRDGQFRAPRPTRLEEMLAAARTLAEGFPEVRVDFYEVNGVLYFGELTFASASGMMDYFTRDFLLEMGAKVTLPERKSF